MTGATGGSGATYEIVALGTPGAPGPLITAAFEDFQVTAVGNGRLRLVGRLRDQAALHGALRRMQLLGLTVVRVSWLEADHLPDG